MQRKITILDINRCNKALSSNRLNKDALYYYLSDDFGKYTDLRDKYSSSIELMNLSGLCDRTFRDIKEDVLEAFSRVNRKNNSYEWWGCQLASKNTASTPLFLNITYFFCAKHIIEESDKDIVFLTKSVSLSKCISRFAAEKGLKVESTSIRSDICESVKLKLYYLAQILSFFARVIKNVVASRVSRPVELKGTKTKKRVVIRSWVTTNTFDKEGKFEDRNFGILPDWLHSKGYEIWFLPMFFNITMHRREFLKLINNQDYQFIIPEHFLKVKDYIDEIMNGCKNLRTKIAGFEIKGADLSEIFNEALKRQGFNVPLRMLNLGCAVIKRIKEEGAEVDAFFYSFECNSVEKQYILSCRKSFPDAIVIGYQHTTFFSSQLAYHFAKDESEFHPLPDKIICSGPKYLELHKQARFPSEMLEEGPNLRFKSVYLRPKKDDAKEKKLLMPLTFSYNLVFDSFVKVKEALAGTEGYEVLIRTHPLLSKNRIINFLKKIEMNNYRFADEGIMQDWFPKVYSIITTGGSITTLEAVCMGVPVIRVIPDNLFHYDALHLEDYPLKPVNSPDKIREQLEMIENIISDDKEKFNKIGKEVLAQYFPEPEERNLRPFLFNF